MICDQNLAFGIGEFFEFGAIDRVILADIDVIHVLRDRKVGAIWDIREGLIRGRGEFDGLSI